MICIMGKLKTASYAILQSMRIQLSLFCLLLACSHTSITSSFETPQDAGLSGLPDGSTMVFDAEQHEHSNDATAILDAMTVPD